MKIRSDFIIRQVAGTHVVMPMGAATVRFDGMMTLNETGVFLWRLLENGAQTGDLVNALTAEYQVSPSQALADVTEFLDSLGPTGCLEA